MHRFNAGLPGTNWETRKTTKGEVVRWLSYVIAICLESEPIDDLWRRSPEAKDIRPPAAYGDHGMSKNRFKKFRSLASEIWEEHDTEHWDPNDSWRFMRPPIDDYNDHIPGVFKPGHKLVVDETMIPSEHQEGPEPHMIPHAHYIERKPRPKGGELNTASDAEAGGIIRMDIEKSKAENPQQKYAYDWSYTSALNFRIIDPWLFTGRCFSGDARFMGVDELEDLSIKVCYLLVLPLLPLIGSSSCGGRRTFGVWVMSRGTHTDTPHPESKSLRDLSLGTGR